MESSSTAVFRALPFKNGISPYALNCGSGGAAMAGIPNVAPKRCGGLLQGTGRQRRAAGRHNSENRNTTLDSLNYWKRAFNQVDPAAGTAAVGPERLVRVGGGGPQPSAGTRLCGSGGNGNHKVGTSSGPVNVTVNDEVSVRRPTPPPGPPSKALPTAVNHLLKTLSPIQNSPQFLRNAAPFQIQDFVSKRADRFPTTNMDQKCGVMEPLTSSNRPTHHYNTRRNSRGDMAVMAASFSDLKSGKQDAENEGPIGGGGHDTDDDLVFSIEI